MLIKHCNIFQRDLRCASIQSPEDLSRTKCVVLSRGSCPVQSTRIYFRKKNMGLQYPGFSSFFHKYQNVFKLQVNRQEAFCLWHTTNISEAPRYLQWILLRAKHICSNNRWITESQAGLGQKGPQSSPQQPPATGRDLSPQPRLPKSPQPSLGPCQGRGSPSSSEQPAPGPHRPHSKYHTWVSEIGKVALEKSGWHHPSSSQQSTYYE